MRRKNSRSLLSLLLVMSMLFSMLPIVSVAAEHEESDYVATVYVDGTNGVNDTEHDGSTEAKAKKGMTYAYQALYKAMEAAGKADDPTAVGRIIVLNDVKFTSSAGPTPNSSDTVYAETHPFTIVVTGKTGSEALVMKNNYINLGPTIYENITLAKADGAGTYTFFCANGYPLVIGEGVTCEPNASGSYMSLMGGVLPTAKEGGNLVSSSLTGSTADDGASFTGNTSLTVKSGTWRNIYAGSYKGTQNGDASLSMTGGTVTYKAGATFTGTVDGDVTLDFDGVEVQGNVYGGRCGTSGEVTGSVSLTLENSSVKGTDSLNGDVTADAGVEGSVTLTLTDSTVDGTVSGADTLYLTASAGETLSIGGGKLNADSFTGGGTLVLGDASQMNADDVTGETQWEISGTPSNVNYISAPADTADDAFTYVASGDESAVVSTVSGAKYWGITGGQDVVALKLTAPEDVTLKLFTGFNPKSTTEVTPDMVTTAEGITTYAFNNLKAGNYHYTAEGTGYYSIKKNIYYSAAEAAEGQIVDCDPGKMADNGFEQTSQIALHTDEVMDTILNSDPDQEAWAEYRHIFDTPYFTNSDRAEHQQATQDELMDFLAELDGEGDNMYTYIAGYTPVYDYEIPVAIFTTTDLSGAETLEEAAKLVNANGKTTVHYQAMIHPNEPASGAGILAMIDSLDGSYGEKVLDDINIYVIPRINGDGAYKYQRTNVAQSIDMNRDHLYVQSKEVEIVHKVYNLFMPEVTIDGHEFTSSTTSTSSAMDDVQVGTAGNLNSGEDFTEMAQEIVQLTFAAARELDLRPYNYGEYASTVNNAIGRPYYALYGSLSFLIETRGIGSGLGWYERRTISQYIVAETIINYVAEHADTVQAVSNAERQRLVELGGVYGEQDDVLVLEHGVSKDSYYEIDRPSWNLTDGSQKDPGTGKKVYYFDQIISSRTRPTAYVISKGESWAETVTGIMDKNGIEYYEVESGSAILLQQYKGSKSSAEALDEQVVIFEDGAYVFPMDQVGANVLAMTMEPDVVDSEGYNGTLLQSKVVAPDSNGMIPIYRHIRDLDENGEVELVTLPDAPEGLSVTQPDSADATGTITGLDADKSYEYRAENDTEYTTVPAGSTEISGLDIGAYYVRYAASGTTLASYDCKLDVINEHLGYTVYVDGTNGSDEAVGWKETAAVKTLVKAYETLETLMKYAPEGTEGQIVFLGTVTLAAETDLPAHDYTVVLTSKTGTEGISSKYSFSFNGPTCLEDMTITLTTSNLRYIAANGHKMVIGENVTCVPSGSYYFNLAGGGNSLNVTNGTDLTVQSGTFRNIYAAGYKGTVAGDVKFTMTGGSATAVLQSSYSGSVTGDVEMNLSNTTIGGIIYGGNTNSGNVKGDVTITLGEDTAFAGIYTGSRDSGDVTGTANVIVDGAEVGAASAIIGGCKNETGSVGDSVLTLKSGSVTVSGEPAIDIQPAEGFELVTTADGSNTTYTVKPASSDPDLGADAYVMLDGEWHFNLYRQYSKMFQYFAYSTALATGTLVEGGHPAWPEKATWQTWDTLQMPSADETLGGLHGNETMPTWSESWVIREFDLPENFTNDEYVTLFMGIIDDNDVIYINGTPVASSGFVDGNGNKIVNDLENGGFDYSSADKADQVKWEKSYWEVEREYQIPADVLNQGGTNVIGVRVFNNNSNGGFFSGKIYAICGNDSAIRAVQGLPSEKVESPEVMEAVAAQNAALEAGDLNAYAAVVADNYHNDADDKADKLAEIEAMLAEYDNITVTDTNAVVYKDEEGGYWYTAERTITSGDNEIFSGAVEICFQVIDGEATERGNWNRCYGTSYDSELFDQELTYSVYLPPSYYENDDKEYPVVWLLHGQNSSSTSYRDVDNIGGFMDEQIAEGNIMEMVLIMPDSGKNAFYRDSEIQSDINQGGPWRTQLTEELRAEAQANYRIMTEPEFNGLTGNSMGAYGSIMAGTTRPDLYSSIGMHMGFLPEDALNSLKALNEAQGLDDYDFYLDCGLQDQTVGTGGTKAVHEYLESVGKEHGYSLRDGAHNSAFYMSGMAASMKMHSDHFEGNFVVTVDYQTNGGSAVASETIDLRGQTTFTQPANPAKNGYTFAGWYTDAELTSAYDFTTPVIRDLTLYAKWTENSKPSVPEADDDDYYYEPTYRVEVDGKVENGSISVSPKYAEKGDTVSVTVNPDKGYELDELTVTDRQGHELAVTYKNGKYTFKMPVGKVAVNATFIPIAQIPFTDVAVDDWYYDAVRYAYVNDIMAGMGDNKFAPNAELLRSMVAQVLYNLDEDRYTAISSLFSDVVAGEWYVEAINWAVAEGIFAGYGNGTFGTMDSVTREQLAMILYNYAVSKGYVISGSTTLGVYADADMTSGWAVGAMEWAIANDILRSVDGLLTPKAPASRAEVAYAMMQFCELFKN